MATRHDEVLTATGVTGERMVSQRQAAVILNVTYNRIVQLRKEGRLRSEQQPLGWMVYLIDVEAELKQRRTAQRQRTQQMRRVGE